MTLKRLSEIPHNAMAEPSKDREGVDIVLSSEVDISVSQEWTMGGWKLQFVRMSPNTSLSIDQSAGRVFIKVVTGELANLSIKPFGEPKSVRSTLVSTEEIVSGTDGCTFSIFIETADVKENVHSMDEIKILGPLANCFEWRTFEEKFGAFTNIFDNDDAYMSGGFHLLDDDGTEITYVNLWTAGKAVNLSTHNHGGDPSPLAPAFAEVHWVFNNGTGQGAMYECTDPDSEKLNEYPVQRGEEHGPFFVIDEAGKPQLKDNGAVDYPWHGWEAGQDSNMNKQAYDVVAAFETNPNYVFIG